MSRLPRPLFQWATEVSTHLPHLSRSQITVIAMYSFGMVIVGSCGITSIVCLLSVYLGQKEDALRQRLREILYNRGDKRGRKRQEIKVEGCFAPLLRWVISWWTPDEKRIALALDATTLGQRFTVLSISVMYRGCAIPVAWVVLRASQKEAWNPHWKRLLNKLRGGIPDDWIVIVLTDRGLYAKPLFKAIQKNGWHPMMRINSWGKFRPLDQARFRPLSALLPKPNMAWYGEIDCFATPAARLRCTLLAHWDVNFDEPWLLVTDLPPETADAYWYGMRMWIEQGFKDCKRGGFRWEQTKMTDPVRATRLWLIMSIATLWAVSVGGQVDPDLPPSSLPDVSKPRRLSCHKRGLITIIGLLLRGDPLPLGSFFPEPWPFSSLNRKTLLLLCQGGYGVHY